MKIYFTITGTSFRYGNEFFKKGMRVQLEKEPDNEYDREAIKVMLKGLGHVGYVANSPRTVLGESWSAGRLYDKIGNTARGKVLYVLDKGILCVLDTKKHSAPEVSEGVPGPEEETDGQPGLSE